MALAGRKRKDIVLPGVELAGKHSLIFFFKHVHVSVCMHAHMHIVCVEVKTMLNISSCLSPSLR